MYYPASYFQTRLNDCKKGFLALTGLVKPLISRTLPHVYAAGGLFRNIINNFIFMSGGKYAANCPNNLLFQ
jgi:hypothetical protein